MLHTRAIERGAAIRIEVTGVSTPASAKKKKTTVFRCWFNFFLIISERKKRDSERGLRITLFCFVSCFFQERKKKNKKTKQRCWVGFSSSAGSCQVNSKGHNTRSNIKCAGLLAFISCYFRIVSPYYRNNPQGY